MHFFEKFSKITSLASTERANFVPFHPPLSASVAGARASQTRSWGERLSCGCDWIAFALRLSREKWQFVRHR
jgi:hypothetical protein